jgi:hypothetical protein
MPNWCENNLEITGDIKEIKKFKKQAKAKETDLSFKNFIPMPKKLENTQSPADKPNKELIKKYGADNWYDWNIKNWGTKWDTEAELTDSGADFLWYYFDTAWSPPTEWLKQTCKLFKKLSFELKYDEPGMGFCGTVRAENGKIICDY